MVDSMSGLGRSSEVVRDPERTDEAENRSKEEGGEGDGDGEGARDRERDDPDEDADDA